MPKIMPVLGLMGMSILVGHFLIFLGMSVLWWTVYGLNAKKARGVMLHQAWWSGLLTGLVKDTASMPDPYKREYHS